MWTPVVRQLINVLGVRDSGTALILHMFTDGFKVTVNAGCVSDDREATRSKNSGLRDPLGQ